MRLPYPPRLGFLRGAIGSVRRSAAPILVAALFPGIVAAGTARASERAAPDLDRIDEFIRAEMSAQRIAGLALAITHDGKPVHVRGYGFGRTGEPVTRRTQFRIASLSKSFTAIAVLQLVEAGALDLDAPLARYLPAFAPASPNLARITIRQLLNQTSGLADSGFIDGLGARQTDLATRVAGIGTARQVAAAGSAFQYFDPNYQLLARLVELASGQAFDDYLQTRIFKPFGMQDSISTSTTDAAAQLAPRLARGHLVAYGMPLGAAELAGFVGGSGGVVSSAQDMARYLAAQDPGARGGGGAVLSAGGIALMRTPPGGGASSYGMGWFKGSADGLTTIEHNGILSTFYSEAVVLPHSGYGFVLLYNEYALSAAMFAFPALKNGVAALLAGHEPVPSRVSLPLLGLLLGALSAVAIGLAGNSLLRLSRWARRSAGQPAWRALPAVLWALVPALLLLGLPRLVLLASGRYFDHAMLARAMPEVVAVLLVCGTLGVLNGCARLLILMRRAPPRSAIHGRPSRVAEVR